MSYQFQSSKSEGIGNSPSPFFLHPKKKISGLYSLLTCFGKAFTLDGFEKLDQTELLNWNLYFG